MINKLIIKWCKWNGNDLTPLFQGTLYSIKPSSDWKTHAAPIMLSEIFTILFPGKSTKQNKKPKPNENH